MWERLSSMYEDRKSNGEKRATHDVLKNRSNVSINTTTTPTVEAKSDESETLEEVHTALMAKTDNDSKDKSEVRKQLSKLEKAYEDLQKDSQILITHCSGLKKINEKLTFQLSKKDRMIQELSNKDFDFLDKNESLCSQSNLTKSESSQPFEEVEILQQKVKKLTKDLSKFVKRSENLKIIMGISRHPYDKSGLGYEENKKYDTESFTKYSIIHNHKHFVNRCCDWKQKLQVSDPNPKGPKKIWVPRKFNVSLTGEPGKWGAVSRTNPKAADTYIS